MAKQDPKELASMIVSAELPTESSQDEDPTQMAAEEVIAAIKSEDKAALVESLRSLLDLIQVSSEESED